MSELVPCCKATLNRVFRQPGGNWFARIRRVRRIRDPQDVRAREEIYTRRGDSELFGALKFLWNATRGHRLTPWRSEFLRWRVETYSGKPAESLKAGDVFGFMWEQKWELLSFLFWTGDLEREARRRP